MYNLFILPVDTPTCGAILYIRATIVSEGHFDC